MAQHDRRIHGATSGVSYLGRRHGSSSTQGPTPHRSHHLPSAHHHSSIRRRALLRSKGEFRLVFYPGVNLMVVIRKSTNKEVCTFAAMGGGSEQLNDGHTVLHTPAGHFLLGKGQPHVTERWWSSMIPWGAEISLDSHMEIVWSFKDALGKVIKHGEVTRNKKMIQKIYELGKRDPSIAHYPPGATIPPWTLGEAKWKLIETLVNFGKDSSGKSTAEIKDEERIWRKNDFGPRSYKLLAVDPSRKDEGIYVHTTPKNENVKEGELPVLETSHGCIHVRPIARDEMEREGALREGAYIEVKGYDEVYTPLNDVGY